MSVGEHAIAEHLAHVPHAEALAKRYIDTDADVCEILLLCVEHLVEHLVDHLAEHLPGDRDKPEAACHMVTIF